MKFETIKLTSDLTVVGAGMSGICAAIEAARAGLSVVLINNRGYLGGNASPEIRIDVCGADGANEFNYYARETGIIEEIRLENLYRNPQGNVYLWHNVLLDWVLKEKNIQLFLNTNVDEVVTNDEGVITYVAGSQLGSEKHFEFISSTFVDDTGDGTVGYLAGADCTTGREARDVYNERIAPVSADKETLLSTLSFYSKDTKRPAPFVLPDYIDSEPVKAALAHREIPDKDPNSTRFEGYRMQWFYETGFGRNPITESEEIIHDHRELIYSVWDYIKNSGNYDSANYDLEYVSAVPGKRESRRILGDHVLTENDIVDQVDHQDVVGHGGWSIDLHASEGFFSTDMTTRHYNLHGIYGIPFRSCYSKNVPNLLVASRCMSTSHVAFGSTRVMATLSTIGQAVGSAAALCKKYDTTPSEITKNHIDELQQSLLKSDQHVLGHKNNDELDLVRSAKITTSSNQPLELADTNYEEVLSRSLALILPVEASMASVELMIKSSADTTLKYGIYTGDKVQNYGPQTKLGEGSLEITSNGDYSWYTLPLGYSPESGKVFIELIQNDALTIAMTKDSINGVVSLYKKTNPDESTFVDIMTHLVKKDQWSKLTSTICFRTSDDVKDSSLYQASNINNGYNRNYRLPNLWLSEAGNDSETILIDFDAPSTLSTLNLTFDTDLNMFYDNVEIYYDFNIMPALVKDYKVYAMVDGDYKLVAEVKDNHQRVNHLAFESLTTNQIKVVLENTNGSKRFGVYEIRAYA